MTGPPAVHAIIETAANPYSVTFDLSSVAGAAGLLAMWPSNFSRSTRPPAPRLVPRGSTTRDHAAQGMQVVRLRYSTPSVHVESGIRRIEERTTGRTLCAPVRHMMFKGSKRGAEGTRTGSGIGGQSNAHPPKSDGLLGQCRTVHAAVLWLGPIASRRFGRR